MSLRSPTILLILAGGMFAAKADATVISSVKEAMWQADFAYYLDPQTHTQVSALPAGVTLACTGTARADGAGGCTDMHGAGVESSNGELVSKTVDALGGLQLSNAGTTDYAGTFVFTIKYSSFNPNGPSVGITVDDAGAEYASFFSVVSGPGAFDLHGCTLIQGPSPGTDGGMHTCGLPITGFEWGQTTLGPLAAGSALTADYLIHINVAAQGPDSVPEAPTLLILAGALGLLSLRLTRHA